MPDLLVPLLSLPPRETVEGVTLRRARAFELTPTRQFCEKHFGVGWADEATVALTRTPPTLTLATVPGEGGRSRIVGFACVDATAPGFFGPTGVDPADRGRGIGRALLLESLHQLRDLGHVYAFIGAAGPVGFYEKTVGARVIDGSDEVTLYTDLLERTSSTDKPEAAG